MIDAPRPSNTPDTPDARDEANDRAHVVAMLSTISALAATAAKIAKSAPFPDISVGIGLLEKLVTQARHYADVAALGHKAPHDLDPDTLAKGIAAAEATHPGLGKALEAAYAEAARRTKRHS